MQTYRVIGAPHYVSHWNSDGYEISIKFDVGALVNSDQDLPMVYRGKFELAPYDPLLLNIDTLHNPPNPPSGGGCCGGNGNSGGGGTGGGTNISSELSNIPEHYFFVDDIARDNYFEEHEDELKKDVIVVSGNHLQTYDGTQWVYLAYAVRGKNATVSTGVTTTGEPGTEADVQNVGTETNAVFAFTIPRGDKGDAGIGGDVSATIDETVASPIGMHRLVSRNDSGKIVLANFENPHVIGLTLQAASQAGAVVSVLLWGMVYDTGWSFNLTHPVVMNNNGQPVQETVNTYPVVVRVGRVVSATSFFLDIESPIL